MRLTQFIQQHHDQIIGEWMEFARTLLPWAQGMSDKDLRDHAAALLTAVVQDMESPQSRQQQSDKSRGLAQGGALAKVGQQHASQRLGTGFDLDQLVSEYRALRASILRLWSQEQGGQHDEVTRFNEAIDESLTESTLRYSELVDRTREQFLGILGHDLRNPLSAIVMGATRLSRSETMSDREVGTATRILTSAGRMNRMVNDLLDLTRTRLGSGIPIDRKPTDLKAVCEQVTAELEAVHPDRPIDLRQRGDLRGLWDSDRLAQVVSNILANAVQYGGGDPVSLSVDGQATSVVLRFHNRGPAIPQSALRVIFEPMVRQEPPHMGRNGRGLGLGLYIAREIMAAHGGTIDVSSTAADGTTFVVMLPRESAHQAGTVGERGVLSRRPGAGTE